MFTGLGDVKEAKAVLAFSEDIPRLGSHASLLVAMLFDRNPKLAMAGATVTGHGAIEQLSQVRVLPHERTPQTRVSIEVAHGRRA